MATMSEDSVSGSPFRRAARLASVPLSAGARALNPRSREANPRKTAEQLASVLGELKGGAMKVGQALSIFAPILPDEFAEPLAGTLRSLQAEAPPLPAASVHRVLDRQLGTAWRTRFREFDDVPVAAASIGQVHKAVWSDGSTVAVKVQYPGADKAIKADLRQLKMITPILQQFEDGMNMTDLVDEIADNVLDELDYRIEADHQRAFHAAFGGGQEPRLHVPKVYASAPKVLVSEWVEGVRLGEIIEHGTQEQRSCAAEALTVFEFASPDLVHRMHTDPHPGNFLLSDDGVLTVIDFGACIHLPEGLPRPLIELVAAVVDGRKEDLLDLAVEHGYVTGGREKDLTPEEVEAFLLPFAEPLSHDDFVFTVDWLKRVMAPFLDPSSPQSKLSRKFGMPKRYIMIHRILAGAVAVLAQLSAPAPYRQVIAEHYPEMVGLGPGR